MEKGFGFGYDKHMHLPSHGLNLKGAPLINGYLNMDPSHRYPYAFEDLRNWPLVPDYGFQQPKASEPDKLQNWFYPKPHFHQVFSPLLNSASVEKFQIGQADIGQQRIPIPAQKRFLVFDQSGDKTTLLYSSGVHTPVQFGACRAPNPPSGYNSSKEDVKGSYYPLRLSLNNENNEANSRDVTEDEMHENTEELDALLCSDDESDSSEDDETRSTGHSPSSMTDNGTPKLLEGTSEEVDSFSLPNKRQKVLDGRCLKTCELESDAEWSCGSRVSEHKEEVDPRCGCKRWRRDKVDETVSILQSIIPDGDGKDAIVVIDEAIRYLRSLKVKAKALGLNGI